MLTPVALAVVTATLPAAEAVVAVVTEEELGDATTTDEPLGPVVTALTIDVEDEVPAVTDLVLVEVPAGCSIKDTSGRSSAEEADAGVIDDEA